jgi:hypothetical protein
MPVILQVLAALRGLFEIFKFGKEVIDEVEDKDKCPTEGKKSDEKPNP